MIEQDPGDAVRLRSLFSDEQPGFETVVGHLVTTGNGRWWVDDPARPRAVLVEVAGNWVLRGDPATVPVTAVRGLVKGFVDAPPEFAPVLRHASVSFVSWERVRFVLDGAPPPPPETPGAEIRRLRADDAPGVAAISEPLSWITNTWGGPAGLAGSGYAWGAFLDRRLVAVACTFFRGFRYEELGVVTEPEARRRGLSTACAAALCADVTARGHRPSWSTSLDNVPSRGVATALGFRRIEDGVLYLVDVDVPVDYVPEG